MSKYSDETRAAVIAALLTGQSISQTAKEYKIPKGTVSDWRRKALQGVGQKPTQKREATIGDMVLGLLEKEIIALQQMTSSFSDPEWLAKQNAADAAVLFGVIQDKMFRKIEAFSARSED